jgi:Spy/CpxP family protein refolding chaperone
MNRFSLLLMAFLAVVAMSCDKLQRNNQQQEQPQMGPGGMGGGNFDPAAFVDRQMEELKEGLQLSDEQEKQVREIITAGFETMRQAREEMQDGDREAMREKMQAMREEQTQKIKAVLSEEQFAKYEQIQAERRERMRQNGFGGQGGPQN